jgi:hypothetical protein
MSNGPAIETYRGIEIKYGHKITEGLNYVHFDLPARIDLRNVAKTTNSSNASLLLKGGERKLSGQLQSELLEQARREIDRYFDG